MANPDAQDNLSDLVDQEGAVVQAPDQGSFSMAFRIRLDDTGPPNHGQDLGEQIIVVTLHSNFRTLLGDPEGSEGRTNVEYSESAHTPIVIHFFNNQDPEVAGDNGSVRTWRTNPEPYTPYELFSPDVQWTVADRQTLGNQQVQDLGEARVLIPVPFSTRQFEDNYEWIKQLGGHEFCESGTHIDEARKLRRPGVHRDTRNLKRRSPYGPEILLVSIEVVILIILGTGWIEWLSKYFPNA